MRKQYDYYVNNEIVSRQEMMRQLKSCCVKVTDRMHCGGGIYADFVEPDEKKFNKEMRVINNGAIVIFTDVNKTFRRKERKQ